MFLSTLGLGLNNGLRTGSAKGFAFSVSGVCLSEVLTLLFLEFEGLVFVCLGNVTVLGERDSSRKGKLILLFPELLASLVLLNLTLLRLLGGFPPELPGLLGFALESALGSSEEISLYRTW